MAEKNCPVCRHPIITDTLELQDYVICSACGNRLRFQKTISLLNQCIVIFVSLLITQAIGLGFDFAKSLEVRLMLYFICMIGCYFIVFQTTSKTGFIRVRKKS